MNLLSIWMHVLYIPCIVALIISIKYFHKSLSKAYLIFLCLSVFAYFVIIFWGPRIFNLGSFTLGLNLDIALCFSGLIFMGIAAYLSVVITLKWIIERFKSKKENTEVIVPLWGSLLFFIVLFIAPIAVTMIYQMPKIYEHVMKKAFPFEAKAAASIYYGDAKGVWPPTLDALVPKYLQTIPEDGVTGSSKVVPTYDGTGGWVYDKHTGDVRPNFPTPTPSAKVSN